MLRPNESVESTRTCTQVRICGVDRSPPHKGPAFERMCSLDCISAQSGEIYYISHFVRVPTCDAWRRLGSSRDAGRTDGDKNCRLTLFRGF